MSAEEITFTDEDDLFHARLLDFPDGELVYTLLMYHRGVVNMTAGKLNHFAHQESIVIDTLLDRFAGAAYQRALDLVHGDPSPYLEAKAADL